MPGGLGFRPGASVESPGDGERKHVLALRKHAEHQQLSLPAAGPNIFRRVSFLGCVEGNGEA